MVYKRRRSKMSVAQVVKRELAKSVEVKRVQTVNQSGGITSAGTLWKIWRSALPAVGDGRDQRIGNEIHALSHNMKILMTLEGALPAPAAQPGYNVLRYALVRTYNPVASANELFEPTTLASFTAIYAMFDYDIVEKVYMNKTLTVNQRAEDIKSSKYRQHYFKLPEKVNYTSSVSDSQTNLYLVLISDSGPLSVSHPNIECLIQSRYTDQ